MGLEAAELMAFVPVSDVARACAFYVGVLGCVVRHADDYGAQLESGGRAMRLARVESDPPPYTVVGWSVASIADTVHALADAGVAFRRYEGMDQDDLGIWATPGGDHVAWFADSEGNTLSLTQFG
jgi:predicted enzyme related to lactoylglutathione lyase